MPRLLPPHALDAPSTAPRWAALAALAALAAPFATGLAVDAAPASLTQQTTGFTWDAEALAAGAEPARADLAALLTTAAAPRGAQVTGSADGDAFTLTAAWEPGATVTAIRLDHYTDHHGEGLRIGIAARTATGTGEHCLALAVEGLDTALGETSLRTCVRTDAQTQNDTYPGRGDTEPAGWEPGHLFVTQTAELTPTTTGGHLVDYLGLAHDPGDAHDTGLWGPHWWQPMGHRTEAHGWHRSCEAPDPVATIPAPPVPDMEPTALPIPACVPIHQDFAADPRTHYGFATAPFTTDAPTPLSAWTRYNDAAAQPTELTVAAVADLRTCETAIDRCHTDTGGDWLNDLLDVDCAPTAGRPCPGPEPGD